MATTTKTDNCRRCKGKGWGDWVVINGRCYACWGTGRESDAKRRRAFAKLDDQMRDEVEDAYVTLDADSARTARWQGALAFDDFPRDHGSEVEVEPGLWAVTYRIHPDWAPPASWAEEEQS